MTVCVDHKRGSTFSLAFSLPDCIDDNFFESWRLEAQLRKERNLTPKGLIAQLTTFWGNQTNKVICVYGEDTQYWPIGKAELDIRLISDSGSVQHTKTVTVNILNGISK